MASVTFFVGGFPVLSETFVLNQVAAMVESGFDVKIIAISNQISGRNHPWVSKYNLLDKLVTAYSGISKLRKLMSFTLAVINDLCSFKWSRFSWIRLSGVQGYMLGRCFNNVEGPVICHFGPIGALLSKLKHQKIVKDIDVITIFHGYDMSVYSELEREMLNYERLFLQGSLMLPISDYWAEKLIKLGCDSKKIKTHHMGVDLNDFQYLSRYEVEKYNENIRLICVCRFVEKKGLFVLLKAISHLPSNFVLTLVGTGPLKEEVLNQIEALNISERVIFEGAMASDQVVKKLEESDAFVLPSLTASNGDMEGIPVALMEAMASGLLVFSSYHSGIPELIDNGNSGFLVEEGDDLGLAETINNVFLEHDSDYRQKIAINARKYIESEFDLSALNKKLENILTDFLVR